ncbi:MAG: site-2 protease family protein [Leptospiraceae bacterium]|nr:site-2 protease family protein [Leptospiraceae bacterium]
MKWSLYIGRLFGVRVYLHWTFLLLLGWIVFAQLGNPIGQMLMIMLLVVLLFGSVLLHELGHALMARRFRVLTRDIVLLPIGGMARLRKMPEEPRAEFMIALAGPLVNALIAIVLLLLLLALGQSPMQSGEPEIAEGGYSLLRNLLWANAILAGFNLIPAFPMDGGRVLRGLLGFRMSHERATTIAAEIGQALGIGFVILGFIYSLVFIFIGIFVFLGASAESSSEQLRSSLRAYTVSNILIKHYSYLRPEQSIMDAVELLLSGQEQEFLVMEDKEVVGVLTKKEIFEGLARFGNQISVRKVMVQKFPHLHLETTLEEALRMLQEKSCPLAPVYRGNKLVGVLDKDNIEELLTLNRAMQQYLDSPGTGS